MNTVKIEQCKMRNESLSTNIKLNDGNTCTCCIIDKDNKILTIGMLYEFYQAYLEKQNNVNKKSSTNTKKIPKKDKLKKFKTEKKQKELVSMFKEQGMTLSQIAKKNGCEAATVRDALKSIIGEDEYRKIMQDRKTKKSEDRKKDKLDKLRKSIAKKQAQLDALN